MTDRPTTDRPNTDRPNTEWSLDREIVIARVYAASRDRVFAAWTDPAAVGQWFGPEGYVCTVHEMDAREGGRWRFDFVGPDGTLYTNRVEYLQVEPGRLLVFDHGNDIDDDPTRFRVTVTFDEQSDGKTVLTLRQIHPTVEQRNAGVGFGAVELGLQTLAKLDAYLGQ
jgi:uncharacterized protein YndB with AHSA1/START domain